MSQGAVACEWTATIRGSKGTVVRRALRLARIGAVDGVVRLVCAAGGAWRMLRCSCLVHCCPCETCLRSCWLAHCRDVHSLECAYDLLLLPMLTAQYEDLSYDLCMNFPEEYPYKPPKVRQICTSGAVMIAPRLTPQPLHSFTSTDTKPADTMPNLPAHRHTSLALP
jgi:Ubiquitin-conjugating enzyme